MSNHSKTCAKCGFDMSCSGQLANRIRRLRCCTSVERFWGRVSKSGGCWIYAGAKEANGYGYTQNPVGAYPKFLLAHRASWIITNGSIPDGLQVLHRCDVPACCNPAHLFLGTIADNCADKLSKHRQARGENTRSAKLTEAQAREILSLKGKERAYNLAQKYGVKPTAINAIWSARLWKHIHEENAGINPFSNGSAK